MAQDKIDDVCFTSRLLITSRVAVDKLQLIIYLENVTHIDNLEDAVELSSDKLRAIVTLTSPVNLEEVKTRMMKKQQMDIQVAACPITDKVVIKGISEDVCSDDIELYFEDKRTCPHGGDVLNVELFDNRKSAIIQFQDRSVAESVATVSHPYLGPDVEVRLWSPLVDVKVLKTGSSSDAIVTHATVMKDSAYPDPVVDCAKKRSADPVHATESVTDSSKTDEDSSCNYLEQKSFVDILQSQAGGQAVRPQCKPRQPVSCVTSDVRTRRVGCCPFEVIADSEVQFWLLKQLLRNGFAREHQCRFKLDERRMAVTLMSEHEEGVYLLGEQLYECKNSGTFEVEVDLSPGLSRVLYDRHRPWLFDRLSARLSDPVYLKMSSRDGCQLAVVALSQNTAEEAAKKLRACLVHATVPLTDSQQNVVNSAKFRKQLNKIMASRAIDVKTGEREIIVDGWPHDVVCAVSDVDRCLNK